MHIGLSPSRYGTLVVAAAVALFFLCSAASAKDSQDRVWIKVNYADLNLDTDAGVRQLHYRLRSAARQACDVQPFSKTRSLNLTLATKACYRDSLAAAVEEIDNERLTALVNMLSSTPSG